MSRNFDLYFDENGELKDGISEKNPWLSYLVLTDNVYVNAERIESVGSVSGKETLEYVFRTLDILDELLPEENKMKFIISEVLN